MGEFHAAVALLIFFGMGYVVGRKNASPVTYHVHVPCCRKEADRGD